MSVVLFKIFFNLIVSIGCAVIVLHPYKSTGSTNTLSHYSGRQERNTILNKKRFKTNLYMHETKGNVALLNINREKITISKSKVLRLSSASVCSWNVLKFWAFFCLVFFYKKRFLEKSAYLLE